MTDKENKPYQPTLIDVPYDKKKHRDPEEDAFKNAERKQNNAIREAKRRKFLREIGRQRS